MAGRRNLCEGEGPLDLLYRAVDSRGQTIDFLLSACAGLLRDYDPLGRAGRQLKTAIPRLRKFAALEQVDRLEAWRARQEMLAESSKSDTTTVS